jgi:hypothetical protein
MCSIRVCLEAFCLALSNYALEECRKDTGSELPAFAKVCEGENRPPAWDSNPQNGAYRSFRPPADYDPRGPDRSQLRSLYTDRRAPDLSPLISVRSPQNVLACVSESSDESTRRQLTVAKGDYENEDVHHRRGQ